MEYIPAKTIVTRNKNNYWFGTDYNMNIYKGCCHGCIYCDSRSDCYRVKDFDRVRVKENALFVIRDDLSKKSRTGVVATGSMSDPYNPFERKMKLTRNGLELLNAYEFGVAITTKSSLLTRDIDILCDIKSHSPTLVKMTITTVDDDLCKQIEPNVAMSSERFTAIRKVADNNIFCGILLMPVLPYINDTKDNIVDIVRLANDNGARFVYPSFGVTLRSNQRDYYYSKLDQYFPGIKEKYITNYSNNYSCNIPNAKYLYSVFVKECERLGLLYQMKDITRSYKEGYCQQQMSLF